MPSKPEDVSSDRAEKSDILTTILGRQVPDAHTIESCTTVITDSGTIVIHVYSHTNPKP